MQLPKSDMTNDFYRAFEDRHRGTRERIKSRLQVYVPFVEPLTSIYEDCQAVDLGCGRGEWLEILGELGFDAMGIDLDDGMLAACKDLGLPAEQGEAIAHLRTIPDESLAVVSGFHIAEHIAFADLQTLVQESLRVLRPAGLLILETPNPENLAVGTATFYLDPTHLRPLPPPLLSFLPEYYGFARTKVLRLQESIGLAGGVSISLKNVLTDVSPDFAVVAQKEANTVEQAALFDPAFQKEYGIQLEALAMRYDEGISGKLSEILSRVDRTAEFEARARAAEGELTFAQQQLAARNAELAQTQQQLAAGDAELGRIRQQLSAAESRITALLSSTSWRLTRPLRAVAVAARVIKDVPGQAKLRLKTGLKPHMVRAGAYIAARPALKSKALRALKPFPRLQARLARAAQPAAALDVEQVTASARRVYQDLLDARAAAKLKSGSKP
jgi:SAM-dependent methyltransferase